MNNTLPETGQSLSLATINLVPDSFIVPASVIEQLEATETRSESNAPNAFIQGLAYTASWGSGAELPPDALANIPVGMQDAAIAPGSISLVASANAVPEGQADMFVEATEAYTIAKKHQAKSSRIVAYEQQKKNVSRRLLLTERSKKLTVTCPLTGIVSLIEIPQIPFPASNKELQKAMIWTSPFGSLDNCRGIAQQGISYLRRLDTQVLAGILITLAEHYELLKSMPFDSGAQKNAVLRTAGKDYLIDAIIMIEELVHSGNCSFLPKLSLIYDAELERLGMEGRMKSYLNILADAIAKPDKDVWDEKKIKPMYPIRPVYIKDVEAGQKKISFLARQEQASAKKQFAEDKKAGKLALANLCKQEVIPDKFKLMVQGLMDGEGMLVVMPLLGPIADKIESKWPTNANAKILISILRRDRRALTVELSELEEMIEDTLEESEEEDDLAPGQEAAIEDIGDEYEDENSEASEVESDILQESEKEHTGLNNIHVDTKSQMEQNQTSELVAPAGLNAWEQLMWKKKMLKAQGLSPTVKAVQNTSIPSVAVYHKPEEKQNAGIKSYRKSIDGRYTIGTLDKGVIYLITDDFGNLVAPKIFPHTDIGE